MDQLAVAALLVFQHPSVLLECREDVTYLHGLRVAYGIPESFRQSAHAWTSIGSNRQRLVPPTVVNGREYVPNYDHAVNVYGHIGK